MLEKLGLLNLKSAGLNIIQKDGRAHFKVFFQIVDMEVQPLFAPLFLPENKMKLVKMIPTDSAMMLSFAIDLKKTKKRIIEIVKIAEGMDNDDIEAALDKFHAKLKRRMGIQLTLDEMLGSLGKEFAFFIQENPKASAPNYGLIVDVKNMENIRTLISILYAVAVKNKAVTPSKKADDNGIEYTWEYNLGGGVEAKLIIPWLPNKVYLTKTLLIITNNEATLKEILNLQKNGGGLNESKAFKDQLKTIKGKPRIFTYLDNKKLASSFFNLLDKSGMKNEILKGLIHKSKLLKEVIEGYDVSKFPGKETWTKHLKTTNETISLNGLGVHFSGEMSLAVIKTTIWLITVLQWRGSVRNIKIEKKKKVDIFRPSERDHEGDD